MAKEKRKLRLITVNEEVIRTLTTRYRFYKRFPNRNYNRETKTYSIKAKEEVKQKVKEKSIEKEIEYNIAYRYSIAWFSSRYDRAIRVVLYSKNKYSKETATKILLDKFRDFTFSKTNRGLRSLAFTSLYQGLESEEIGINDLRGEVLERPDVIVEYGI